MLTINQDIVKLIEQSAHALYRLPHDYKPLLASLANKTFILLGEATHGTREFYQARVDITKYLITHQGLHAIAIEGDWPSAYRVNRYVRWQGADPNANEALSDFKRFPLWMWRNNVILDFVKWLRQHNEGLPLTQQVGFYGLDMYSLYDSIAAVLEYLDQIDPDAGSQARQHYACLDHGGNAEQYGYKLRFGHRRSCQEEVARALDNLRQSALAYTREGDEISADDQFQAEQNARLIQSAEGYYRQIFDLRANTWNLRDSHMIETLDNLQQHLSQRMKQPARIAVWEHNSHIGDARATYMNPRGQHNVGQLARQRYGKRCALIGMTTYAGSVTAASDWDSPAERKRVRTALPESVEAIFHQTRLPRFYLPLQGEVAEAFQKQHLERAIGVIYLPESERISHYFPCRLSGQFDAILHFDETHALEPLDPTSEWIKGEAETYPFGV